MNKCDTNYIEILKNKVDELSAEKIETAKELMDLRAEVVRANKEIAVIENLYDYKENICKELTAKAQKLEEELENLTHGSNADKKLLKQFSRVNNTLNRENEMLQRDVDDYKRILDDTNHVNEELIERVDQLEEELEMAIKGQEDFKKIINDLEAINKELLEELKGRI